VHGALEFLPNATIQEPYSGSTPEQLCGKSVHGDLTTPEEEVKGIGIGLDLDFSAIEAWYNSRRNRVTKDSMLAALDASEYKDMIELYDRNQVLFTMQGLLRRGLRMSGNVLYHFRVNGHDFSAYDSIYHAYARTVAQPRAVADTQAIQYIEGDIPRAELVVPLSLDDATFKSCRILELIHEAAPMIGMIRPQFSGEILKRLSSLTATIGFHSNASQILYHFPFLFDFELRRSYFRLIGFDPSYSFQVANDLFEKTPWGRRATGLRAKVTLRRTHIYEDGIKLLRLLGPGALRFDVAFRDEEAVGHGPTQEFFTIFSQELCKNCHGLWRNEAHGSDYAWTPQGLFPLPNAPPERFYDIGLLCGKAFLIGSIASFAFNPAFFRLILGQSVTIEEVDAVLARSLARPDGLDGLPFTYPGIPELELCPGGSDRIVTVENVAEFIALVKQRTVELPEIVTQFRTGLSTIVPWAALRIFSPSEIVELLCGEAVLLTREDLVRYVEISHGYTAQSPQIAYFYDVIVELPAPEQALFIKFVTGSDKLPIGGLKSLDPRISVALRKIPGMAPDETFPTVMSCTNYFKLPEYSTKDVMREKLLVALHHGQEGFGFS
jgi:hypothetical protein